MSGRSPRPDFGRTDYRFKINDNFGMLHETTLCHGWVSVEKIIYPCYTIDVFLNITIVFGV